jgi:hypothetical protein
LVAVLVSEAMEALNDGRGEEFDEIVTALASQDLGFVEWPEIVDQVLMIL